MSREKEIEAIRELQRDLRGKLDTLDRRIGELEKRRQSLRHQPLSCP